MPQFIVDVNLPVICPFWRGEDFLYIKDVDDHMPDGQIWELAKKSNRIILTRDSDFSKRIFFVSPPPKIVFFKMGNIRINEMKSFLEKNWDRILELIEDHKLVTIYSDRIEALR